MFRTLLLFCLFSRAVMASFSGGVDYLYWQEANAPLFWAQFTNSSVAPQADELRVTPSKYGSGVRVEGTYACSCWWLLLRYNWVRWTHSGRVVLEPPADTLTLVSQGSTTQIGSVGRLRFTVPYHSADALVGLRVLGCLSGVAGVQFVSYQRNTRTRLFNADGTVPPIAGATRDAFAGTGPTLGVSAVGPICGGFSWLGEVLVGGLVGIRQNPSIIGGNTVAPVQDTTDLLLAITLRFGASYSCCVRSMQIAANLGWENRDYRRSEWPRAVGRDTAFVVALSVGGPYVGAALCF